MSRRLLDEVTSLVMMLEKTTEAGPTLDILKRMDELEGLTVNDMKVSKVVFAVKKVRKTAGMSEDVTSKAAGLIDKWRRLAEKEQAAAAGSSSSSQAAPAREAAAAPKAAPKPAQPEPIKASTKVVPPQAAPSPTASDDGAPDISKFGFGDKGVPAQRQKMRNLFFKCFLKDVVNGEGEEFLASLAVEIEIEVHKLFDIQSQAKAYADKIRSLKYNLERNAELRAQIISGEVLAEALVKLKPEEMLTSEERAKQDRKKSEFVESRQLDYWDERADDLNKKLGLADASGTFRCGRCKGEKTTYTAKQTRSSDEPMTMFIRCLTCGNRWKQN